MPPKRGTLAKLSIYKTPTILSLKHLNLFICAKFAIEIDGENRLTTAKKISGL
jgi:hypothetical protein